ncbi:MAG TPA: HEAT repeat domain-containing protein, partial [Acidobacteriota bacterium]|nr:HEAT repeat domain-containing protein [Acidobacteriota bacterium]
QLLYSLHSSQLLSQPDLISLLTPFLHHPHRRVRGTTLFILQNIDSPVVMDAIKQLTNDSDEGIRAVTALELAKRSTPLELNRYELILFGPPKQFAVGADQLAPISPKMVYEALIPHLSPDILQLFLRYPCPVSSEMPVSLFQAIAKAVTNNPPLLELLLEPPPSIWTPRPESFDQAKKNLFVDDVFRFVGAEAIPTVQAAKQSSDPRKQERLDSILKLLGTQEIPKYRLLPPGQSRGFRLPTVTEILAKNSYFSFKPSELGQHTPSSEAYDRLTQFENNLASLPVATQVHQLTRLFIQSQQTVITPSNHQYQNWGYFGAIGEAWPGSPQPFPFKQVDTDILQTRIINKINEFQPNARQFFFQYLLTARQNDHRMLAIRQLAEALDEPIKVHNRKLLKSLLSDSEIKIVIAATVSLVRLDDSTGRSLIASWMSGDS